MPCARLDGRIRGPTPGPDRGLEAWSAEPTGDERMWGMGCHLAALLGYLFPVPGVSVLGPLLIWLARREESDFVADQGLMAVNFQITMSALYLFSWPLVLLFGLGFLTIWIVAIANALFIVAASIRASMGERYRYPFSMELVRMPAA